MNIKTLNDLFIHTLSDTYSAEKQMLKALPKLAEAAESKELKDAFLKHEKETERQIERLESVVDNTSNVKIVDMKCKAMEGLVKEGQEIIDEIDKGPVRDAGLICAAQKVEHYEIAGYGTLCALAANLGYTEAKKLLGDTLEEEKATDKKLTMLAERKVNDRADNR